MEARKLLEYYYNLILFRPEYPASKKSDHLVTDERTYVPYESIFGGESVHGYEIYIGKTETEQLSRALGEEIEDAQSFTYLCMIRTDKRGYYVKDSFFISPVLFALAKIIKERNAGTLLDLALINRANDEFDEFLIGFDRKLEYRELNEIFNYVVNKLNLSEFLSEFKALVKERDHLGHNVTDGYLMNLEEILSSREKSEKLENVASSVKKVLKKASPIREDYTPDRVKEMTSPEKNSMGMWPGNDRLTLREQLITNQMISGKSVPFTFFRMLNQPKQALRIIPEIMTSNLIERAAAMTRYSNPDDAFKEVHFKDNKEFATAYHLPEERLLNSNLVILGNNPAFIKELETKMDPVMAALHPAPYFTVSQKPYLVQKYTSNRDVVRFVRNAYKGAGEGFAYQLNDGAGNWEETRRDFRTLLDEVLSKREEIMQEYRTTMGYQDVLEKVSSSGVRIDELKARIESSEASKAFKENELNRRKATLDQHHETMQLLKNEMGFFKRFLKFLFARDEQVILYNKMEEDQKKLNADIESTNRELNLVLTEYHNLNSDLAQVEEDYSSRKEQLNEAAHNISTYKEKYGKAFADDEIIKRLVRENLKLDTELWISEEYNDLRKKLLAQALKVHKAFLSSSRSFKTDMTLFTMVLEGKVKDRDLHEIYVNLLKVSGLLSPMIYLSTQYEPYFLSVAQKEGMGNILIPEAGIMPLKEACGALWKFKNITAFNIGEDHWSFPEVPEVIEHNIANRILGMKDPAIVDLSLADVMNVL